MSDVTTVDITLGDTLLPLNTVLMRGKDPLDLANYTVKAKMVNDAGTVIVNDSEAGVTKHPTQAVTFDATNERVLCNSHGFRHGDQVVFANSGGGLPADITAGTRYLVRNPTRNTFQILNEASDSLVTFSGAGTGTHTVYQVGSVQYDLPSGTPAAAGTYWLWLRPFSGSEPATFPATGRTFKIRVNAAA